MRANGQDLGAAGRDAAPLFRLRRVRAVTFDAEGPPDDVRRWLDAFARPPADDPDPRAWFALNRSLRSIRVLPERYRGEADTRTLWRVTSPTRFPPVPPDAIPAVRELLRAARASVQAVRRYPAESQIVRDGVAALAASANELGRSVPLLVLAAVEESLLVNSVRAEEDVFGAGLAEIAGWISTRARGSISWTPGLAADEALGFVQELAKDEPDWDAFYARFGSPHIQVGGLVYQPEQSTPAQPARPSRPETPEERLRRWIEDPAQAAADPDVVPTIREAWAGPLRSLAEDLLRSAVATDLPALAARGSEGIAAWIEGTLPEAAGAVFVDRALRRGDMAAAIAHARGPSPASLDEVPAFREWLRTETSVARLDRLIEWLGPSVAPLLVEIWEAGGGMARTLGRWLRRARGEAALVAGLSPAREPARLRNLLMGIDGEFGAEVMEVAARLVVHADRAVRVEALGLAWKLPQAAARQFLRGALISELPDAWATALDVATRSGVGGLAAEVASVLDRTRDAALLRPALDYLTKHGETAAVPALGRILCARPKFLGFGGLPADLRAAAVWALAAIKPPDLAERLAEAGRDPSAEVRSAAKLARPPSA